LLGASVAIAAVAAGVASVGPAASSAGGICGAAGGKTLAHSGQARVYALKSVAYGCANPNGTSHILGSLRSCMIGPPPPPPSTAAMGSRSSFTGGLAGPFAVAGRDAAYGLETCGTDFGVAVADVMNLSTGKVVHSDSAASYGFPEGYQQVTSIVARPDGSDAWIGLATSILSNKTSLEVFKHDKAGRQRLDSGGAIASRSLKLHRSRLTWTKGSGVRHATLR
jgi:hypothetical protein